MKRLYLLLLSAVLILALSACGSGSKAENHASYENPGDYAYEPGWTNGNTATAEDFGKAEMESAKMVFTARIELETLEFDKAVEDINALTGENAGYFQEQNISGYSSGYRNADFVIRVPSRQFQDFCTKIGNVCHTIRLNTSQENVSESYYDVESRLNTAKKKLERLQELLSLAENLEDIITIENAIANTEQDIDYLSGTLRGYDNLVDYATVRISLKEVYRLSGTTEAPLTLGQRIGNAFSEGLNGIRVFFEALVILLAYAWFWILLVVGIAFLLIRLRKKRKNRGKKLFGRKSEKDESMKSPTDSSDS